MRQDCNDYIAKAFLSCSLRIEDKPFVEFVERILKAFKIEPFGTVGLFSAAPTNTAELMKRNIPSAELVVIVATPRYLQRDLKGKNETTAIPEMLHVESGMAFMTDKPIIVFSKEGTNVGSFIPNITQYITLSGKPLDTEQKWPLIASLLTNAYNIIRQNRDKEATNALWNGVRNGLAMVGIGAVIVEVLANDGSSSKNKKRRK